MYVITYILSQEKDIRPVSEQLNNHIKQHRARLDLTQEELADRVGVRRQTILAIEKGKYVPSALLAFKIAHVLGMKVDDLFEFRPDRRRP
jgi:putative transcriptional regulator